MKNQTTTYNGRKQGILPMFISDFLDICDLVLTFDEFFMTVLAILMGNNVRRQIKTFTIWTDQELTAIHEIMIARFFTGMLHF